MDYTKHITTSSVVFVNEWVVNTLASFLAIMALRWLFNAFAFFSSHVLYWTGLAIVSSAIGMYVSKAHKIILRYSSILSLGRCFKAVLIKEGLLAVFVFTGLAGFSTLRLQIGLLLIDFLITAVMYVSARIVCAALISQLEKPSMEEEMDRMNVLVYGVDEKSIAMLIRMRQSSRYRIIGFLTTDMKMNGLDVSGQKVFAVATSSDLELLNVRLGGVDAVLFARSSDKDRNSDVIHACVAAGIHVLVAPKVEEVKFDHMSHQAARSLSQNVAYIPDGMSSVERNTKRIIDMCIAACCIVVFSPLMLVCWVLVRLEDGGPALFCQERIGRFGRPFTIYKFRSMRLDAEMDGPALYSGDDDPRLTRIGRFLRQHHLDELPQLFNVFTGDMAFVGWRPERRFYIDRIMEVDPRYYYLYQIRPGVTSYATLYNGYTDTLDKMLRRLEYDLYYLQHRSFLFDIRILWNTFVSIVFGKKF